MAMFGGFKPSGMQKIADTMGYGKVDSSQEGLKSFNDFVLKDPARKNLMDGYVTKAIHMANGGSVTSTPYQPNTGITTITDPLVTTTSNQSSQPMQISQPMQSSQPMWAMPQPDGSPLSPDTFVHSGPGVVPPETLAPSFGTPLDSYVPPTQAPVPVTTAPGTIPEAKNVRDNTPGGPPDEQTFKVPDSFQLYNPAYIDAKTATLRADLLGGKHTDPNTIPEQVLKDRYIRREQGYTGAWGAQGADEFAQTNPPSFRNLTPAYLQPNSSTAIRADLLGGVYEDPDRIPEEVLQSRLKVRNAGYTGPWGAGGATTFLQGPATSAFRNLSPEFLNPQGTAIIAGLQGGSLDQQPADKISPDILRQRLQLRKAGYNDPWGSGNAGAFINSNRSAWESAGQNLSLSSAKTYFNEAKQVTDVPGTQRTDPKLPSVDAPDVFLPKTAEREYTQGELEMGTPNYHQRLRTAFGFTGDFGSGGFDAFFNEYKTANPEAQNIFDTITNQYQQGALSQDADQNIVDIAADRLKASALPDGGVTVATSIPTVANQFVDAGRGQLSGNRDANTASAVTGQTQSISPSVSSSVTPSLSAPGVTTATASMQAEQLDGIAPEATIQAQTSAESSVSALAGEQGTGIVATNAVNRDIQAGEVISETANAETASAFTEQIEAATATPSTQATVQGQLASLTSDFDASNPPSWAAGAIRAANEVLARRGLGSSSMAGQAIIQATLESALPLAQADASIFAQFEVQNLSNRQQRSMLSAQQRASFLGLDFDQGFQTRVQNAGRISDIANLNFTADQQIQLENSRVANTVNLQNLNNRQAVTLAEASALANLDTGNLNNRQQAAVQNAQNFLQMDLTNLSNSQQTELFKNQQTIQSLFTDQAATNAAAQFNASSENQVNQFFSSLEQQARQYNVTQMNAQSQFNAGQGNVISRFNSQIANDRDQFNATNRVAVDQANAVWRRSVATADTAAVNRANEINASAVLDISNEAYSDLWQFFADEMDFVLRSSDSERTRINNLTIATLNNDTTLEAANLKADGDAAAGFGSLITQVLTSDSDSLVGSAISKIPILGGLFD